MIDVTVAGPVLSEAQVRKHILPILSVELAQEVGPGDHLWSLSIPGEPVAKGRPKFTTIAGHARAYTPKKTERYEDTVKYFARREWKAEPLRDVAITARIVAYRSIPTSLSKAKRAAAIAGTLHPISRPDHDNYSKIVCDALNGIVFADDAAIVDCWTSKRYSEQPRMEIVLTWGAP